MILSILRHWNKKSFILGALKSMCTNSKFVPNKTPNIVLVDGVRTPFLISGTDYTNVLPHELARHTIASLMQKTKIDKDMIDYVVYGTVIQELNTTNVARDAALSAGLNSSTPAHTVTMACISSNQAMTTAIGLIANGTYDVVIAGGVEVISNAPFQQTKNLQRIMFQLMKANTIRQKMSLYSKLRPSYFIPKAPPMVEFTSNEPLGHSADRLSLAFEVSRRDQDEYAVRSHTLAKIAQENGYFTDLISYKALNVNHMSVKDNGIRVSSMERMSKLSPAFIKPHGTVTAGNSSFLTDGASACLIMSETKAKELGLKPKAFLRNFTYVSQDPFDELLLGPSYAIPKLLRKFSFKLDDFDVWEMHEAFAGQILANIKALESDWFCRNFLGLDGKFGVPDMDKWNSWGGSLSIGHPFAATGVRLAMHTANRLIREDGHFGILSACASGGLGVAMILERHPDASIN